MARPRARESRDEQWDGAGNHQTHSVARVGIPKMQTASSEAVPHPETTLRRALWLLVPCLVLVVIHVVYALTRDRPLIFADEAGYIGNARFLAGGLPIKMLKSGAYYP